MAQAVKVLPVSLAPPAPHVHRAELQETDRVLAKAKANGWNRQMEMNERKRTSLINIITSLEETRDWEH